MSEQSKGFKVNDRRRFDDAGNERDESMGAVTVDYDAGKRSAFEMDVPRARAAGSETIVTSSSSYSSSPAAPSSSSFSASSSSPLKNFAIEPESAGTSAGQSGFVMSDTLQHDTLQHDTHGHDTHGQNTMQDASAPELSFSSFLMSLATQALIQMGEIEPPGGIKLPPDFEAAKQSIEIIGMLALKTKGNLDSEEQRLLAEVLHSLRLTFVQRVKETMASAAMRGSARPSPK